MKPAGAGPPVRRHADGSIDFDHYREQAYRLRAATFEALLRAAGAWLARALRRRRDRFSRRA